MNALLLIAALACEQRPPVAPPIPLEYQYHAPAVRVVPTVKVATPRVIYEDEIPVVAHQVIRSTTAPAPVRGECDCANCRRLRDAQAGINNCPCPECEAARASVAKARGWNQVPVSARASATPLCLNPYCNCGCWDTGVCVCAAATPTKAKTTAPRYQAPRVYYPVQSQYRTTPPPAYRSMPYADSGC